MGPRVVGGASRGLGPRFGFPNRGPSHCPPPCQLLSWIPVTLSDREREQLARWARRRRSSRAPALRCRIVLAASGASNSQVAREPGVSLPTVRKRRGRFIERGLDGLVDEPRPAGRRWSGWSRSSPSSPRSPATCSNAATTDPSRPWRRTYANGCGSTAPVRTTCPVSRKTPPAHAERPHRGALNHMTRPLRTESRVATGRAGLYSCLGRTSKTTVQTHRSPSPEDAKEATCPTEPRPTSN